MESEEADPDVYNIPPPPECIYDTREQAEVALHNWTKQHGYNVSKKSAAYINNTRIVHTQYYECDRADRQKNTARLLDSDRVRTMRGSKRSGCPMKLKLNAVDKTSISGRWAIIHRRAARFKTICRLGMFGSMLDIGNVLR